MRVIRLNTIAYYDRILVMDAGRVAEYDASILVFGFDESAQYCCRHR
jgi:hypothetical protein